MYFILIHFLLWFFTQPCKLTLFRRLMLHFVTVCGCVIFIVKLFKNLIHKEHKLQTGVKICFGYQLM